MQRDLLEELLAPEPAVPVPTSPLTVATAELRDALDELTAPADMTIYNPLRYAWTAHARYLAVAASGPRDVLCVGMNPGPWGAVQTGLPFGSVREATIIQRLLPGYAPAQMLDVKGLEMLPRRPVEGYGCPRHEVSGTRFWREFAPVFQVDGTAGEQIRAMLARAFVLNACPLAFFRQDKAASNVTPDLIPKVDRDRFVGVASPCAVYFRAVVSTLRPRGIVTIGLWTDRAVRRWLGQHSPAPAKLTDIDGIKVARITHPSPRVAHGPDGWAPVAALREGGFLAHVGLE